MYETLLALMKDASGDGAVASRALRELRDGRNGEFVDQALKALRDLPESPQSVQLLRMAVADPRTLERLTDPGFLTAPDAIQIARRLQSLDATTDIRLLRLLQAPQGATPLDSWRASRLLEIVAAITAGARIQTILPNLLWHADPRVRSKAALLIGRFSPNVKWLAQQLSDCDARVRANSVESMWGACLSEACELFLTAARDDNSRVAGNGVVGLHRAGSLTAVQIVQKLAKHANPAFRAAAAWAMGEVRDPRFLPFLVSMMGDTESSVRRNVIRATVRIRKRVEELKNRDPLGVTVCWRDAHLEARVKTSSGLALPDLLSTWFVVMNEPEALEIEFVRPDSGHYLIGVEKPPVAKLRVCVYAPEAMGDRAVA
jgi:HEAT repeat protein